MSEEQSINMSDISNKESSNRYASAMCEVVVNQEIIDKINNHSLPKGDIIAAAKLAGILAVKKTHEMIPLCHAIPVSNADVSILLPNIQEDKLVIKIISVVESFYKTGVEMEALAAVSIAGLTIYDMTKSISHSVELKNIRLLEKRGGKSGDYKAKN
ncbi:MAG: cyclic pyranopterin monophosphate synthase MoaC [Chloroflexi bacterium]|nr:cyclic pyranopterin monophosphate synthase MoaC [Chloroflexota bacterium]